MILQFLTFQTAELTKISQIIPLLIISKGFIKQICEIVFVTDFCQLSS